MPATLKCDTITNASNAGTANLSLDASGNATVGNTLAMGSSFLRNKIINGDMRIDQRNAGASGTANVYTVDRFGYYGAAASKGTWQQNAGSVTPPTGFTNYLGFTSSSAYTVGASEQFNIYQAIEGLNISDFAWGTANAKTITVSFWVRSSLTGTFGGSIYNSAVNRSYPYSYTISAANTWEQKSITIAGDTSGTWLTTNGVGLYLNFSLGAGSTVSNTAGSWYAGRYDSATGATSVVGTNGATFYITGVQLEVGSIATPFERRQYGTELLLCQRYYETTAYPLATFDLTAMRVGTCATSNQYSTGFNYLVAKRATATVSLYSRSGNSGKVSLIATGTDVGGTSTVNQPGATGFWGVALGTSQTTGAGIECGWTASAEL